MLNVRTTYQRTLVSTDQGNIPSIPIAFAVYSPLLTEPEQSVDNLFEIAIQDRKGYQLTSDEDHDD